MRRQPSALDVRIDAARFFWARLDIPPQTRVRGTRDRARILDNLFETHLPVPIDTVHATYVSMSRASFIACAIEAGALRSLVAEDPVSLGPQSVPDEIAGDTPTTPLAFSVPINVLHGAFTPRHVQDRHKRHIALGAVALIILSTLATIGMERRASHLKRAARALTETMESMAPSDGPGGSRLPTIMRLTAQLRAAEAAARAAPESQLPPDASLHLASLLQRWIPTEGVLLDSLRIERGGVQASVLMPSPDLAPPLLTHLTLDGVWTAEQPTLTNEATGIRARVSLNASVPGTGGAP